MDTLDADGATLANITTTTYFPDGNVQETSGAQTNRTTHTYDYADRQVSMTTYGTSTATTTWIYSTDRGFLLEKNYQGETDPGTSDADYTYTSAGRMASRVWERGVTTTYGYDDGGRLVSTGYSDGTPDVLITYDALGRAVEASNGIAVTTTTFDAFTLAPATETVGYDLDGNSSAELTRVIDRSHDGLNRPDGYELKASSVETAASYGYDNAGRLFTVGDGTDTFTYGYGANSYGLMETVTSPVHTVTNNHETTRNVLSSKENKAGTTVVSDYGYGVNNLAQRTGVSQDGTAFAAARSIAWGYDSLGQVTKADSSIAGLDRAYLYDEIGNRLKSADSLTLPTTDNYTPNALNQYTTVDSITPSYDADGNATAYPLPAYLSANSTLVWDGENRLVSVTVNSVTTSYRYDSGGRRIATVTSGGTATLIIYDGWNPIASYEGSIGSIPALTKTNLWGTDLSGSMQGAGGVGGLLSVTDGTGTYYPTYDGNGNVSEYLDSTGAVVAHYEYDPFGRTTVATGAKAQDFTHRFSTKPLDGETGLYYYGYRYYDPATGRWPSRDPIEERGGVNLYGFVGNDGPNRWDLLGLEVEVVHGSDVFEIGDPGDGSVGTTAVKGNISYEISPEGDECCVRLKKIEWYIRVIYMDNAMLEGKGWETDLSKFADYFSRFGSSYGSWYDNSRFAIQESVLAHEMEHVRQYQSVASDALRNTTYDYKQREKCFSDFTEAESWENAIEITGGPLIRFKTALIERYPGSSGLDAGEAEAVAVELRFLLDQFNQINN